MIPKNGSNGHDCKRWARVMIPLMVESHCKSYECGYNVLIFLGRQHGVISKGRSWVHNHRKVAHIIVFIKLYPGRIRIL